MFWHKYKEEIAELETKKKMLETTNEELRCKIKEIQKITADYDRLWEESMSNISFGGARGGSYGKIRNLKDFEKWKQTSFWKYQNELNLKGYTLANLPGKELIGNEFIKPEWNISFEFDICAYCDMVLPTSNGPIVHIIDPFGECTLPPAKSVTNEEANKMIGSIIIVKCNMRYYQKDYKVIGFEKLPYTLNDSNNNANYANF